MVPGRPALVLIAITTALLPFGARANARAPAAVPGPLDLQTSDERLRACFQWARDQARAYVRSGDPVGPWYEAALPGRDAFCMRDVAHQALGAHALGLAAHNRNMLRKFALNISESKDWCSYWEINRYDKPAPVDYTNDKEFWYNLPANFDILDACYRMYLWTHDETYVEDPVFLAFYRHTVTDYVKRWNLGLGDVLNRDRFMNRETFDPRESHQANRGIPSYHEGSPGRTRLGVDLLACQAAAYRAYAQLLRLRGDLNNAMRYLQEAALVMQLIEESFWDETSDRFNELLLTDDQCVTGGGMQVYLLHNDALMSPEMTRKTLRSILDTERLNIEISSHYPQILYRYGAHEQAYRWLLKLSDPGTPRREYPAVSFAVIGAIVDGLMGIEPSETEGQLATLSRLTESTPWARLDRLPVRGNVIDVRHKGRSQTTLTNHSGPPVTWVARFYGRDIQLLAEDGPIHTSPGADRAGRPFVWAAVTVQPGASKVVRAPASK